MPLFKVEYLALPPLHRSRDNQKLSLPIKYTLKELSFLKDIWKNS